MSDQLAVIQATYDFLMPAAPLATILAAYQLRKDFIEAALKKDVDYGTIPGSAKPALYKPGAEKMSSFFSLAPVFEDIGTVEDWDGNSHGGEPFFYYRQKCKLYKGDRLIASADGSCNSRETKYRYRWVGENDIPASMNKDKMITRGGRISEFEFALDKAETTGQYGKPAEYWKQFSDAIANHTATAIKRKTKSGKEFSAWEIDSTVYRVPNNEIAELVNTILKMAQKRALVASVLIATNTSDYFTQDIEDYAPPESVEGLFRDVTDKPAPEAPKPAAVHTPDAKSENMKPLEKPESAKYPNDKPVWTIDDAEAEYSETRKCTYGELTNKELSFSANALLGAKTRDMDQERKLKCAQMLLAARQTGRPMVAKPAVEFEPEETPEGQLGI